MNALLAVEKWPRIPSVDDGVLPILPVVNLNENANPEDMVSIRLWIDPHRIISRQGRKFKVIGDLAANIEVGQAPVDCPGFITMLIGTLLNKQLFTALI